MAYVNSEGRIEYDSQCTSPASVTWTSSISPLMNRAAHSPLALSSARVSEAH